VQASSSYAIDGVENMQQDIMTKGPIQIGFKVYASFMSYKSGVYKKHADEMIPEGGHAVKIVGWGVESGEDYWLVANSWGPSFGLDGFFKMKRGVDECGVETMGPPYAVIVSATEAIVV
jgi:cathepsin B